MRHLKRFENISSIDISKDIIQDIYQDLLDTIEWEYEIEYKIYDETLIGICIFDKRLYYQEELRNSDDKFEVIFTQAKKGGWVSSGGMTRGFPDEKSEIVFKCSDRMVNHLGFIKPLMEFELFDRSRYNADKFKANLCGYQFFFTNEKYKAKKWTSDPKSKINESVTDYKEIIGDYFLDFTDNFEYFKFEVSSKTIIPYGLPLEYPKYEKYQVKIIIEERYWNKNKQEISYSINSCINHLIDSTDLKKNGSDNWFDTIDGVIYRVIDKFFITR